MSHKSVSCTCAILFVFTYTVLIEMFSLLVHLVNSISFLKIIEILFSNFSETSSPQCEIKGSLLSILITPMYIYFVLWYLLFFTCSSYPATGCQLDSIEIINFISTKINSFHSNYKTVKAGLLNSHIKPKYVHTEIYGIWK